MNKIKSYFVFALYRRSVYRFSMAVLILLNPASRCSRITLQLSSSNSATCIWSAMQKFALLYHVIFLLYICFVVGKGVAKTACNKTQPAGPYQPSMGLSQRLATYQPRARCGPLKHFTRPATFYGHPARDLFSMIDMQ